MNTNGPDEEDQREHNEGEKHGANAGFLDEVIHELFGHTFESEAYNKGWENGVKNKPKD